ncbi:MAG: aspartate kinase [Ruminococcaceae bacterium]|nr:aspartate kinase [Oscillospiraceae bacterium]
MKVIKFGGSSLADAVQIRKVCDIIISDPERRVVVVSAPGKGVNDPVKVTDMLISAASAALENGTEAGLAAMETVIERYASIARDLGVDHVMAEIAPDFRARMELDRSLPTKFTDAVKAAGEDNSARLTAAYLCKLGCNAKYVNPGDAGMYLSDDFGNAQILPKSYELLNKNLSGMEGIIVFPGFFGRTEAGETVTFPRGGSDITGAILAAALNVDVYENFTDVDYVYSANPHHVENPRPIPVVTYREMRELSYAGFNVYQEEALLPVYRVGIPVNIRNANNPSCPGTLIVPERNSEIHEDVRVAGVACDKGFTSVYVNKYLMNREIGFGRKLLEMFEDEGVSYEHTPTGIDDLTIIARSHYLENGVLDRITARIRSELGTDDVQIHDGLSLIVVVGEGMKHAVGIAAKATTALSEAGINISMISQGSSEVSMIFAVDTADAIRGVQALYNALLA